MMKLKKTLLIVLCSLVLMTPSKPSNALLCEALDLANALVTPLPIKDDNTDQSSLFAQLQQVLQTVQSVNEVMEYGKKLAKLASNPSSLAQKINEVKVTAIESVTSGTQTLVDAYKGTVATIEGAVANFEKPESIEKVVSNVAIVADPIGNVEEIAAQEQRQAFIQQAFIDLHADVLVAKSKLADLKKADEQAQEASSTKDTVGNTNVSIQMKNFENQVQVLEQKIASMRNVLAGYQNLKSAKPQKEEANETDEAGAQKNAQDVQKDTQGGQKNG